jgi:hypothetical protein
MNQSAQAYITCVSLAGVSLLCYCLQEGDFDHPVRFLFLALLASLGGMLKVKLPGMHASMSLSFLPIVFATSMLNLSEIIVISAVAGLMQTLWRPKSRPRLARVAFNTAVPVLGIAIGGLLSLAVISQAGSEYLAVAIGAAAAAYYLVSSILVATVLSLVEHGDFHAIWRNCCLRTVPYVVFASVLALFCGNLLMVIDWRAGVFALALFAPFHLYYRARMPLIS